MCGGFLSYQRAKRQSKTKQNRNPFWAVGCDLVRETEEPQGAERGVWIETQVRECGG